MRIVSLLPSATEILCAIGLQDEIVAVTHECDFPTEISALPKITSSRISHETMTSREIDHAVRRQLDGHGTIYNLDTQMLSALKPDLVVTQELCDVCAVSYQTVNNAVRLFSADSKIVSLEPNSIADVFSTILTVGEMTGRSPEAKALTADLIRRLNSLATGTKDLQNRPTVMMLEWLDPPFAPGHWVPEQVTAAGGIPVLASPGQPSRTIDYQDVADADPEFLIFVPCGYYIADIIRQLGHVQFPAGWQKISAIQQGNVWAVDATSYFSRPGPRLVIGAEILAKILHPGIFGPPAIAEAARIDTDLLQFEG